MTSRVIVLKTSPERVLDDYQRLLNLVRYQEYFSTEEEILIKLNLSWTKYFPACSSQPWQLEGVVKKLLADGYKPEKILPLENKTVVTNPWEGARQNKWLSVLEKYGLKFTALPEVEWIKYPFKTKLLKLNDIFPNGIEIPKMFLGKSIIHLPTVKTHGHTITTGAIKNAFGGLLKEVRHYGHEFIHEVMVDLLLMQKEIHKNILAVMDGTVCGDGAGPRTMKPYIGNYILASFDQVAIDAIAAKMMGFDPLKIPYLRMANEMGLGNASLDQIEVIGDDITEVNFHFKTKRSFVIWGDQMLRKGFLRPFKKIALHSPLWVWAPFASNLYHDYFWYPIIGKRRIKEFAQTAWGKLFASY
jgi:uncharacterized protein (DUF362 family)|uniref:DUF362 domain-containing protein n=1 Tax=candidate division WOR-3 bacterium TaxID=2052148 RepID=A0A7C6EBU5_UNCW3